MTIESGLFFLNDSVMTIDYHRPVIVQDQKGKNFAVKLFLAFYSSIEFDNTFYGNSHTVSVLLVGDLQRCHAALDLANEERKVHLRCSHELS